MLVTENPIEIAIISKHCLERELFIPGNLAEKCFKGEHKIYKIALLPSIAWAMTHDQFNKKVNSYFTYHLYRRKGIAARLQRNLLGDIFIGSYYDDPIWTFKHGCHKCNKFFYGGQERKICKICSLNLN